MRLSKYLSLAVAMSRNQAKFFIRKGRLSVDGSVITDPYFEVANGSHVVFDGKPIAVSEYQYILLHKPASYSCTTKDTEPPSVLDLLKDRVESQYYYFANILAPEVTGLVLLSDDARWTNRIKRRLLKKPRVYQVRSKTHISEEQFQRIKEARLATADNESAPVLDIQKEDQTTLRVTTGNVGIQKIMEFFSSMDLAIETPHLQQLGRLSIGDLSEGDYLELTEGEIVI